MTDYNSSMTILAIAGSLRKASVNRSLVAAAAELAPEGVEVQPFYLHDLPFYNGDLDVDGVRPGPVLEFADAIRSADAVLFATPEYNHVVPGVLANALDWASRPLGGVVPLRDKPVAVMGASPGIIGTARAQDHLKFALMSIGADVLPRPGVVVGGAYRKIVDGRVEDEETLSRISKLLASLASFAARRKECEPA